MVRFLEVAAGLALLTALAVSLWLMTEADRPHEFLVAGGSAAGVIIAAVWWWDR